MAGSLQWVTQERLEELNRITAPARRLLLQAGLWRATLVYWVREQASLEANWDSQKEEQKLDELEKQWREATPSDQQKLEAGLLRAKLRVGPAAACWSREQWGHRLDSLFLESKSKLDRASCGLIRLRSKPLATEIYYRIKGKETTFEMAAREFGEGPERQRDGLISLQPIGTMPFGLEPVLKHLKPGEISQPMRLGKGFCLVN